MMSQMMSLLVKTYHLLEQPQAYLLNVNLFRSDLTEQKPRERLYPPPLYHDGCMS